MLLLLIIICEIAFWLFLLGGLAARYLFHARRLSTLLLAGSPLIDGLLLVATTIDLKSGGPPTFAHGLAAIYLGVSVAFGRQIITAADRRFAAWIGEKTKPAPQPKFGKAHAAQERRNWLRHLLAFGIGATLLCVMMFFVGIGPASHSLFLTLRTWAIVLLIDFAISFSYTLWPKKEPTKE